MSADDGDDVVVNEYGRFTMIPNEIVLTLELSPISKVLYMHFVQMANDGINVKSRKHLAERIGRKLTALDTALKELVEFGALKIVHRKREDRSLDWSEYRLLILRRPRKTTPEIDPGGTPENRGTPAPENRGTPTSENRVAERDLAKARTPQPPTGGVALIVEDHAYFDQVWDAYPKHEDRQAALLEWYKVIRSGRCSQLDLILAARAYAAHVTAAQTEPQFVKTLANWLRAGSYDNPLPTPEPPKKTRLELLQEHTRRLDAERENRA